MILVIGLIARSDRRQQIIELFKSEDIAFSFFDGVDVDPKSVLLYQVAGMLCYNDPSLFRGEYPRRALGCRLAYLKALEFAHQSGANRFIIFQDDVCFREGWSKRLQKALGELPSTSDLLHFSSSPRKPRTPYSETLSRVNGARQLTATYYNSTHVHEIIASLRLADTECDVWFERNIHPRLECYEVTPAITYQRAGYSSILMRDKDAMP